MKKNHGIPEHEVYRLKGKKHNACLCIPVLNEGEKIKKQLEKIKKGNYKVDVIVCDWGSSDGSTKPALLKKLGVTTLLVRKEPGFQATQLRIAFWYALSVGYEYILQIDGNNKDGVEFIPDFIKALSEGNYYVQGSRFIKGGLHKRTPNERYFGIRYIASPLLSLAAGKYYTDVTNGYRGYLACYLVHPSVVPFRDNFKRYSLNFYLTVRANQLRLPSKEIPVSRIYPEGTVPTKMTTMKSKLALLSEVVEVVLGKHHPKFT